MKQKCSKVLRGFEDFISNVSDLDLPDVFDLRNSDPIKKRKKRIETTSQYGTLTTKEELQQKQKQVQDVQKSGRNLSSLIKEANGSPICQDNSYGKRQKRRKLKHEAYILSKKEVEEVLEEILLKVEELYNLQNNRAAQTNTNTQEKDRGDSKEEESQIRIVKKEKDSNNVLCEQMNDGRLKQEKKEEAKKAKDDEEALLVLQSKSYVNDNNSSNNCTEIRDNKLKNLGSLHLVCRVKKVPNHVSKNIIIKEDCQTIVLHQSKYQQNKQEFFFHQIFGEESTQDEISRAIIEKVSSILIDQRQDISIMLYGASGSGKSFTINNNGLLPRIINFLIRLEESMLLLWSCVEIKANEDHDHIKDFPIVAGSQIKLFEEKKHWVSVSSLEEFLSIHTFITNNQKRAKTCANTDSSRGHTVYRMIPIRKGQTLCEKSLKIAIIKGEILSLIDLAGSESSEDIEKAIKEQKLAQKMAIQLRTERKFICNSLLSLRRALISIAESVKTSNKPPFRLNKDSRLTRNLSDILTPHNFMIFFATIDPSAQEKSIRQTNETLMASQQIDF